MDLGLAGKTAVVTGASRGIGRGIALALAREGMRLALAGRDRAALQAVAAECGGEVLVEPGDLRLPEEPPRLAAAAARFGAIDLVVANAGATRRGDFLSLSDADFADGFALKFFGHVRLARAAWPHLVRSRGAWVQIAGVGGRTPGADFAIGGPVNAALMAFTKCLADRGVAEGVRVCAVNPGSIATDRLQKRIQAHAAARGLGPEAAAADLAREMGVARFGTPGDIGSAVAFLASAPAAYLHGAIVDVDGGATRTL